MKIKLLVLAVTGLVGINAQAQNSSSMNYPQVPAVASQGVRVGLVKPSLKANFVAKYQGKTYTASQDLSDALGLSVGYARIPTSQMGWTANLTYLDIKNGETKTGLLRADGNLAWGFNQLVHLKGGLNITKFTSGTTDVYKPNVGLQGSVGLQATPNIGVDLGFVVMRQTAEEGDLKVDLAMSGFELGVNGTF